MGAAEAAGATGASRSLRFCFAAGGFAAVASDERADEPAWATAEWAPPLSG